MEPQQTDQHLSGKPADRPKLRIVQLFSAVRQTSRLMEDAADMGTVCSYKNNINKPTFLGICGCKDGVKKIYLPKKNGMRKHFLVYLT